MSFPRITTLRSVTLLIAGLGFVPANLAAAPAGGEFTIEGLNPFEYGPLDLTGE
jgi:hypothetical protein